MKKTLNLIVSVVPMYILMFLFNNSRTLFSNYESGVSIFQNVQYISLSIIVAFIAIGLIVILNKEKLFKNKLFLSSLFVILSLSFLNGIFRYKNLDNYIVLYLFLLLESYVISNIIHQKFNISIFIVTMISLIFMAVIEIFNLLIIFKYCIAILTIISLIYLIYSQMKEKKSIDENLNEKSLGIVIFSIMFIVFVIGGINRYIHIYDEYSHWAFDAKAVIEYDKLSTCEEVMSPTRTYPPALSLWHYFINIFVNSGNESHLYIGLSIFILIALMPCFSFVTKKNKLIAPIFTIAIYFSCYLFGNVYNYTTLYADYALSAVFATSVVFTLIFKDDNKKMMKYLLLGLSICCIIKPSGIVLAGVFILIKMMEDIVKNKKYNSFKINFKNCLKKWWKLGFVLLFVFISWNVYTKICNRIIYNYYDFRLLPDTLATNLSAKLNSYTIEKTAFNLIKSFSDTIISGVININLYQYFLLMIIAIIFIIYMNNNRKFELKMAIPYIVGYILFFILTFGSMFVMFTKYEAEYLASFGRYLNPFHYAVVILFIVTMLNEFDLKLNTKRNNFMVSLVLIFFIFNISFSDIFYFIGDYGTERKDTYKVSMERKDKVKIVNENTSKDSQVYVLDQRDTDGIMAMWYSRYYMFPRRVNASSTIIGWKIRTDNNADDLKDWGLKGKDLQDQLYNYNFNYLFLYTYDEEMFKQISFMLNVPYNQVMDKYTLFKVQKNNNKTVSLIPVA